MLKEKRNEEEVAALRFAGGFLLLPVAIVLVLYAAFTYGQNPDTLLRAYGAILGSYLVGLFIVPEMIVAWSNKQKKKVRVEKK